MNTCNEVSDKSQLVFMFEYSKNNISTLNDVTVKSAPCTIRGITWTIGIRKRKNENTDSKPTLGVFLYCECESTAWCCKATVRLTILSQKAGCKGHSLRFRETYSSKLRYPSWGFPSFIEWNQLTDPFRGFIKNDSIKIQAHIVADAPLIFDLNFSKAEDADTKMVDELRNSVKELKEDLEKSINNLAKCIEQQNSTKASNKYLEKRTDDNMGISMENFMKFYDMSYSSKRIEQQNSTKASNKYLEKRTDDNMGISIENFMKFYDMSYSSKRIEQQNSMKASNKDLEKSIDDSVKSIVAEPQNSMKASNDCLEKSIDLHNMYDNNQTVEGEDHLIEELEKKKGTLDTNELLDKLWKEKVRNDESEHSSGDLLTLSEPNFSNDEKAPEQNIFPEDEELSNILKTIVFVE